MLVKPRWAVKTSGISGEKRGVTSKVSQETRGFLRSSRRFSTIIDVTRSGTAIYVGGAVAIGEDCVRSATYVNVIFWQLSRNSGRAGTDSVVGLDLGEGCVGTRRTLCRREPSPSPRGSGRSRRDVASADDRAGPRRVALPRHLTRRRSDPQPPCSGRGGGNSGIIKGGCAERPVEMDGRLDQVAPRSLLVVAGAGEVVPSVVEKRGGSSWDSHATFGSLVAPTSAGVHRRAALGRNPPSGPGRRTQ